jgi:hypothetical protein
MNLNLGYNPSEMPEPENTFDALPAGDYLVTIEDAEPKQSKTNGNNWYLNIKYSVIGADYTNRKIFEIINFKNDNPIAEKIAGETLGQLARACGINGNDSDEYKGRNLYISVGIKQDPQYGAKNNVKKRYAIEGGSMPSAMPTPAATPQAKKPPFFGK